MCRRTNPDEETTDWRAVCGRTARTVRRAGTAKAVPDPYQAIQAAQALKVTWKKPAAPLFPNGYDALYDYLAKTPPQNVSTPLKAYDIEVVLASSAHTITATYQSAFQSHASMTPGCCVADVKD